MIYSQNNEQTTILEYFGDTIGSFLDIGANDGKTLSNTHALALLGWAGICIEPDPEAFYKLSELYKGDNYIHLHELAIANQTETLPFFSSGEHLKNGDTGLLSSLSEKETKRWKKEHFDQIEVKGMTFADFLKTEAQFQTFDFISIDAEGFDYDILCQIDLRQTDTKLVCIEFNNDSLLHRKMHAQFKRFGFKPISTTFENLIYGL